MPERLTKEQSELLDGDAFDTIAATPNIVDWFRGEERPGFRCSARNALAWQCRVLDLLDANAALLTRAEQAEADRDTLARLAHRWNNRDLRQLEHDESDEPLDNTDKRLESAEELLNEAWRSASAALSRAGGGA